MLNLSTAQERTGADQILTNEVELPVTQVMSRERDALRLLAAKRSLDRGKNGFRSVAGAVVPDHKHSVLCGRGQLIRVVKIRGNDQDICDMPVRSSYGRTGLDVTRCV